MDDSGFIEVDGEFEVAYTQVDLIEDMNHFVSCGMLEASLDENMQWCYRLGERKWMFFDEKFTDRNIDDEV